MSTIQLYSTINCHVYRYSKYANVMVENLKYPTRYAFTNKNKIRFYSYILLIITLIEGQSKVTSSIEGEEVKL